MAAGSFDIAIIGAGMAGASLAAAIGDAARVVLIEAEAQPGYHATGRSVAFWLETYGGPAVRPLTAWSRDWLEANGLLRPRGAVHLGAPAELRAFAAPFDGEVRLDPIGREQLGGIIAGLRSGWDEGLVESGCCDIDVAAAHASCLRSARQAGAVLLADARVGAIERFGSGWRLATASGMISAPIVVNAAGAWASEIAALAGATPLAITPMRRTVAQIVVDPPVPADLPLVLDVAGRFYFKPEPGGRLWLSPHDETAMPAQDVAPDEHDVATAIARLEQVVDWRVARVERAWAGLRSFAPDRAPVYGFDARAPGFFWFAGQGGFGIQTAPAAAALGAALLLGRPGPDLDPAPYGPSRF